MRGASQVRAVTLLRMLETGRRWTVYQLAQHCQVHPRTVRRDIESLEAAGVPICHAAEYGQGCRGEWWLLQ